MVAQAPDQLEALVSRDAATDDEKDTFAAEVQNSLPVKSNTHMDY
jgi:hypothetical protein